MKLDDIPGSTLEKKLASLDPKTRARVVEAFQQQRSARAFYCDRPRVCDGLPHEGYDYNHARADQWPPLGVPGEDWLVWAAVGGRGSGKTRTGAEHSRALSKRMKRLAIVAPTGGSIRDTIVEGPSGLISVCEMAGQPGHYEPSKRRFTFASGCIASLFSAEEPDRFRGPQFEFVWFDEPAHYPKVEEVWDMAMFGLRLGVMPHALVTTTPLPTKWMKKLLTREDVRIARASTYANLGNLAPSVRKTILSKYEGTRLGRQELHGEILEDVEGALWQIDMVQHDTVEMESLHRIVIGVDPAGSANRKSDETGIIVVGQIGEFLYVLEDGTGKYTPRQWAMKTDDLAKKWGADAIVVERNYGGDMVKYTLESIGCETRVKEVNATRGKRVRAEPVVAKYEQGKVFHFPGLADLEGEQTSWVPDSGQPSPNRVDALVWAITELARPGAVRIGSARGRRI